MLSILSSPAKRARNDAGRFPAAGEPPAPELCREMDGEMRLSFVGPMPVKQFFQTFLPTPLTFPKAEKDKLTGFEKLSAAELGNQMYDKFVSFFSAVLFVLDLWSPYV